MPRLTLLAAGGSNELVAVPAPLVKGPSALSVRTI
jgi:hypothetical protein